MSNLEALRKRGNFTPKESFIESEKEPKFKINQPSQKTEIIETDKYIPSPNQRKTLKVSPQTKKELEELKRYLKVEYNYEAIQFLIDNYVNSQLTAQEKNHFKDNTL
ncbi:hypothetical protein LH61_09420 [Leuconostoc mesenteroides P45]|uniref:hypothetical protein n=1 Tax=Leuconostoc mesenteroides TaxID=1245 RepID=UPI000508221F|nr:hypothetical protein [Leuconostoc mesenteroides]KGB49681.1 hypothetical protein LH61_09420 [Leuconostoc mesenteroides P45]